MTDMSTPAWVREIDLAFPVTAQFVITGNIRDVHLVPEGDDTVVGMTVTGDPATGDPVTGDLATGDLATGNTATGDTVTRTTEQLVVGLLVAHDYDLVYSYDSVAGIRLLYERAGVDSDAFFSAGHLGRTSSSSTGRLADLIRNARAAHAPRVAVIVGYAARLWAEEEHAGPDLRYLLALAEKQANSDDALSLQNPGRFDCTIFWLADHPQDAPGWLTRAPGVRLVNIPKPTLGLRTAAAALFLRRMREPLHAASDRERAAETVLADLSQGMTLREIDSVVTFATEHGIDTSRMDEALRSYRLGVGESPWSDPLLLDRLNRGEETIGRRVLGQPHAVEQALTVLTRSAMGLTGAQFEGGTSARPQGILFFAGPTGVGKTELAKSLAEILFGAQDAYIRFDMSEFSAEHSEARLIGAPPGYVGHDAGGELTNAIRERPFSILLFDEIEKAHPRILDKFLQILEDGRLTDGAGETVYFSEAVIVFTSNLGTSRSSAGDPDFAQWGDDYADTQKKVRRAIDLHFTEQLQRPELLSRIGDNIVVFDFISEAVGRELVAKYLAAVTRRVRARHGLTLTIGDEVVEAVADRAVRDLSFGGRGVGSVVESMFVNPLTRALTTATSTTGKTTTGKTAGAVTATRLELVDSSWRLELVPDRG
jgi:ATP-dependent Clp protease ATP-binding subunit ClpB